MRAALERVGGRMGAFGRLLRRTITASAEGQEGEDQQRQRSALEMDDFHGDGTPAETVIRSMSVNKV